ncbi:DNA alkylation repair protein [Rhizobiales bacterium RZME27]|uniref:DNA alkylation repair protein n=1 Tax=Endobacterium cereale TaxID=2663029 RepID=A0A6A8ADQ4_9HYPH|nr:DNA alkylation repair protein [Endobacterium cereale]MEB2845487.1 DNA alkylation repair protein [Endobacterium cereale]MQY48884.1 DNA alkylation repair protein [Endobacterium cereale]
MTEATTEAAPLLKEIFNRARLEHFASETAAIHPGFDGDRFLKLASEGLDDLSIMQRLRQIAVSFHATLPGPYEKNLKILRALAPRINHGFASITLPEYVALYGHDDFDLSMRALAFFTQFGSSEFAIRHFLQKDQARTLMVMEGWSKDENEHVRRLSSEGCRPRLPWSFQLKELIADPSPVATILENLRSDPALYVRKSVANHLNDITKDHPDWVLQKISGWDQTNAHSNWIIRQALRTLIKKGDARALHVLGAGHKAEVTISSFVVTPSALKLGSAVKISTQLTSTASAPQKLVVDYAVHYVKKASGTSKKVFKWKEITLDAGVSIELSISRAIRDFTTRVHYPGRHAVDLIVNGEVLAQGAFEIVA